MFFDIQEVAKDGWFEKTAHIVNLVMSGGILLGMLKQYGIYVIAKDRLNKMWCEYCEKRDIDYEPLGKDN